MTFVQASMGIGMCFTQVGEMIGWRLYGRVPTFTGLNAKQAERLKRFGDRHGPLRMVMLTLLSIGGIITSFVVALVDGWIHAVLVALIPFAGIMLWSVLEYGRSRRRVIRGLRHRGRLPTCPRCGYDVSKTPVSHCSECGAAVFPL